MSNTPGITPLTTDLEEVRHSDDEVFDAATAADAPRETDDDEPSKLDDDSVV